MMPDALHAPPAGVVEAELCEAVPIGFGHDVAVLGASPRVAAVVAERGALPLLLVPTEHGWRALGRLRGAPDDRAGGAASVVADAPPLPLQAAAVDHLLVPELGADQRALPAAEIRRVLKPGGWLAVATAAGTAWPGGPASGLRWLAAAGCHLVGRFGVAWDASTGAALVPLDHRGAAQFFVEHLYIPPPEARRWTRRLAAWIGAGGREGAAFEGHLLVARRGV